MFSSRTPQIKFLKRKLGTFNEEFGETGKNAIKDQNFSPKRPKPDLLETREKCQFYTVHKLHFCGKQIEKSYEQNLVRT